MTRVHPLGGAAIFKSCAPSVIFWALGIILRTGFLSLSSESCDLRPTWQRWRLLKTSNISLWIIFIRASIIIFQRLVLYIIANRSFITSACVSKFFCIIMWNRWRKTKWTNFCVKNQLQHVSLNYNLAKKFLENLLRMEFDFDFFWPPINKKR